MGANWTAWSNQCGGEVDMDTSIAQRFWATDRTHPLLAGRYRKGGNFAKRSSTDYGPKSLTGRMCVFFRRFVRRRLKGGV